MYQSFMIVLREGVESFLLVAIIFAYLRKTGQRHLLPAVLWGVAAAVMASSVLAYFLWMDQGASQPFWEGVFAAVTAVLVSGLVIHMWKVGPHFKQDVEHELSKATTKSATSFWGVLFFTVIMVSREGMEMVLMLFQIQDAQIVTGILLGVLAAAAIAVTWQQFGYLINMATFFRATSVFLLLFIIQIFFQSFHEFTEAGIFPNSEYLHEISEPFSSQGLYGKMYLNVIFFGCALWLAASLFFEKIKWVGNKNK